MKAYWIILEMFDIGTTLEPRNHEVNNIHSETKRMVEVAFEQYRSLHLPFTPSRLNCIFVAPTKESAKEWSELLFCDKDNIEFFLYEVEIQEDTVWKNAQWYNNYCMDRGKTTCEEYISNYWKELTYEDACSISESEGLCTQPIKILKRTQMHYSRATGTIES